MLFTTTTHQQCSKCWRATHSCPPRHQPHHPNIWCQATPSPQPPRHTPLPQLQAAVDDELSRRPLELDPCGYFIVLLDREAQEIVVEWYTNTINKNGVACDPETGRPIPCTPGYKRAPSAVVRGGSAKEVSVALLEGPQAGRMCSHLEHANYLGRELQKAEFALAMGMEYVQD